MKFLFYIFYFIFINCFFIYSYIDPGTGSMLFAVLTGIVSTLFFVGKTFLIKIKTLSFRGGRSTNNKVAERKKYVLYSEGKQY